MYVSRGSIVEACKKLNFSSVIKHILKCLFTNKELTESSLSGKGKKGEKLNKLDGDKVAALTGKLKNICKY